MPEQPPPWLIPVERRYRRPGWFKLLYVFMTLAAIFMAVASLHGLWWLAVGNGIVFVILFETLVRVARR